MYTNKRVTRYDAVIVLGMNIRSTTAGFRPSSYQDHDEFGMLGGEMNVIAATLLYEQGTADTFIFSTGVSAKTKAAFGEDAPTEAEVYSKNFLKRISDSPCPKPTIILEDHSVNTYSNLTECIQILNSHGWKHIAIMSARYHIPRVAALWELTKTNHPSVVTVDFLIAEEVIIQGLPGIYDAIIEAAYSSPEGQRRLKNEAQGLQDMKNGKYVVTEFQFHKATASHLNNTAK
jgi:hypothetical protein